MGYKEEGMTEEITDVSWFVHAIVDGSIYPEDAIVSITTLTEERDRLRESLQEMVSMMDSGDESGFGSEWHMKATLALTPQESDNG